MGKPLLIVVDDEPDMAELVQTIGEMAGFDSKMTTSAKEFQKVYSETEPSLIVMDIVMPDMDGNELLQWLAKQQCSVPVIIMSGYKGKYIDVTKHIGDARGIQIIGTLTKPIAMDRLQGLLKEVLDEGA
jgi:DNA-binding NtrC family response regulator